MTKSQRHENLLYEEIYSLQDQGWHVMDTRRTRPDAIAINPERTKIYAIEVLGRKKIYDSKGTSKGYQWTGGQNVTQKRWAYQNYDDIIFILFDRNEDSNWKNRIVASEAWPGFRPKQVPVGRGCICGDEKDCTCPHIEKKGDAEKCQ